jgi:uncharacterized protein YqhQ
MRKYIQAMAIPYLWVDKNVGGQAVIEGVMMRSPVRISTSVRQPNGDIVTLTEPFVSLTKRVKVLGWPIIRGIISFFEMLVLGIKTLNYSAEIAAVTANGEDSPKGPVSKKITFSIILAMVFALAVGIGFFFFLPLLLAQLIGVHRTAFGFNIIAGIIRVAIFIAYIKAIAGFKDIQRVFAYHGAEHKSIYAFENELPLTVENASKFSTLHPRCGTSFLLIVALFAIFVFSISDTIFAIIIGHQPMLLQRFAVHFSLLPLIAGISYELLKLSGRTRDSKITKFLVAPGLWLQTITTREPDAGQLEVAITALKSSIEGTELEPKPLTS